MPPERSPHRIPKQKPGPPKTTRQARVPTRLERLRRILAEFSDVVAFVTAVNPPPLTVWYRFATPELLLPGHEKDGIIAEVHPDDLRPLQSSCARALLSLKVTRGDGTRECYAGGYRYETESGRPAEFMAEAELRYMAEMIMDPDSPDSLVQDYNRIVRVVESRHMPTFGNPAVDEKKRFEARCKLHDLLHRAADLCHRIAEEGLSERMKECEICGGVLFDVTQRNDARRHPECAASRPKSQTKKDPPA